MLTKMTITYFLYGTHTLSNTQTHIYVYIHKHSYCPFSNTHHFSFRGAAGSGRDDDNPETLHKRFETYNKDTMPMVEHLEKEGLLRRINAMRTVEEVYEDVKKLFIED